MRVKVCIPEVTEEEINIYQINPKRGLILTENPKGVIQYIDEWMFYTNAQGDDYKYAEEELSNFIKELFSNYPNIQINYYPEE